MNYLKIARFLSVALKSKTFPDFMMEIVFRGKADLGTPEYYEAYLKPILYGNDKDDSMPGVNHEKVIKHLRSKFYDVTWFPDYLKHVALADYLKHVAPKQQPYDDIGAFDPSLSVSNHSES